MTRRSRATASTCTCLTPFVMGKDQSHLDVYSVSGGNLTHIQATPSNLAVGQSGVGVH